MNSRATPVWRNIRLVVFDLDGTLVDSKQDLAMSVNAMRESRGFAPLPLDLVASYVGHGVTTLVRRALGDAATEESIESGIAYFLKYYHDHMLDHTAPYPGVREALGRLQNRKLAVLTNKPVNFSREMLARLGFASCFAFIYGGNSFPEKKPAPVGLRKMMEDLEVTTDQTLMVGDSDTDVLTGKNAGVWTCGVTYGFGAPTLEQASPDFVINDLRELATMLDGNERDLCAEP